jgi:hypothetical protein
VSWVFSSRDVVPWRIDSATFACRVGCGGEILANEVFYYIQPAEVPELNKIFLKIR